MKIYHKHSKTKAPLTVETNSGEILVENRGFLTTEQQVKMLLDAGRQLVETRALMYQYDENGKDLSDIDGTTFNNVRKGDFETLLNLRKQINRKYSDKFAELVKKRNDEVLSLHTEDKNSTKSDNDTIE